MKLADYIQALVQFVDDNPGSGEMEVITAKDAEGNGYEPVYFGPSLGHFNSSEDEFYNEESIDDLTAEAEADGYVPDEYPLNAVCVN